MLVPIWAATWEIECCQPEAEVGKEWKVPVIFRPGTDPWWVTDHGATATEEQRQMGVVRLDATSEQVDEALGQQLMSAGPLSFRAESGVRSGVIEGRLNSTLTWIRTVSEAAMRCEESSSASSSCP